MLRGAADLASGARLRLYVGDTPAVDPGDAAAAAAGIVGSSERDSVGTVVEQRCVFELWGLRPGRWALTYSHPLSLTQAYGIALSVLQHPEARALRPLATAPLLPWRLGAARTSDTVYSIEARGGLVWCGLESGHVEAFSCAPPGEAPTTTTTPRSPGERPPSLAPRPLRRWRAHASVVYSLKASKRALYSCGGDGELRAWHRSDGRLLRTYRDQTLHHKGGRGAAHQKAHGGPARCVLRLGDLVASGGNDKRVKLWLALDPDASHDDGAAPPDGDEGSNVLAALEGHTHWVRALAAVGGAHADKEASDERRLLSASREVILWRILLPPPAPNGQSGSYSVGAADGGGFLLSEALAVFPLAGGAPPFYSLAATDHFCYAGDATGTVCVWALPTGEPQPPLVATSRRGGPLRALARTSRMLLCGDGAGGVSVVDAWTERTDGFQASAKGLRAIGATRHEHSPRTTAR